MFQYKRRPTPPGEILAYDYLEPNRLTVTAFARKLGVSRKHVSDIVNGRARVTPALAVRLARTLGTTPTFWVNLQSAVDVYDAEQEFAASRRSAPRKLSA